MLPDFMESREASAEKSFDQLDFNPADDTCKCANCGERYPLSAMNPASANPFAMPICDKCCDPGPAE